MNTSLSVYRSELNACIDRILAGDSAEACLQDTTLRYGRELEPLLKTAVALRDVITLEPPSGARQEVKQRVFMAVQPGHRCRD